MLPFGVIQPKQFRALQQASRKLCLTDFPLRGIELISRRKLAKLNRQIQELRHPVTCRKRTIVAYANRQKIQKRALRVRQPFGRWSHACAATRPFKEAAFLTETRIVPRGSRRIGGIKTSSGRSIRNPVSLIFSAKSRGTS